MYQNAMEDRVHQIFETIADKYDLANGLISLFQHKRWRRDALKKLNLKKGARVLDLCCGTGDWTISIASEVGPRGKVYGIDFSEKMLEKARHKVGCSGLDNVILVKGNVRSLPFQGGSFDYATIGFGLRNVANYLQTLEEIKRILIAGGKVAILETSKPSWPVMRPLYLCYLRFVVPLMGALLVGSFQEYYWLYKSTLAFPEKEKLVKMLEEIGFKDVSFKNYWGGVTAMHLGTK
jgi:demethylmenaquinone methyltransferase/2-methoxy-6-polyprenyl-1,4-benzoquinol methylase